jgi:GNAT superfamily N-acetyltransferase
VGDVRISDPDLARRLVLHEARAQHTPTRELRDLGDGWLLHDPGDAEPFWNRVIAPQWPVGAAAFDRRLDEITTLFTTLDRLPHVRPLPAGGAPIDLAARLTAAGFETMGADRRMVLVHRGDADELVRAMISRVQHAFGPSARIEISRRDAGADGGQDRSGVLSWAERRRWAAEASVVLADAFGVDAARRIGLENDVIACLSRPGCAVLLVSIDGVPAAIARRATNGDGSYLSSIGTRPAYRGRGLGALATAVAVRDAVAAGSTFIHLGVEVDNGPALRLYERLGFATVGEPAPDMLLFR